MVYNQEQAAVVRYALSELVELLKSPTSADRDADAAKADRTIEVAKQLLDGMNESASTASADRELQAALESLVPHVLHYASMQHASGDAARDAANARTVLAKHQVRPATVAQLESLDEASRDQDRARLAMVTARTAGQAIEAAFPWGYRSTDSEP